MVWAFMIGVTAYGCTSDLSKKAKDTVGTVFTGLLLPAFFSANGMKASSTDKVTSLNTREVVFKSKKGSGKMEKW